LHRGHGQARSRHAANLAGWDVQHVYTKVGGSTRAAAAMFAMKHGLLGD
jgi:hypothetical protein